MIVEHVFLFAPLVCFYVRRTPNIMQERVRVLKHDGIDYVKRNAAQGSNRVREGSMECALFLHHISMLVHCGTHLSNH